MATLPIKEMYNPIEYLLEEHKITFYGNYLRHHNTEREEHHLKQYHVDFDRIPLWLFPYYLSICYNDTEYSYYNRERYIKYSQVEFDMILSSLVPRYASNYYSNADYIYYSKYLVQKDNIERIKNHQYVFDIWNVIIYSPFVNENIDYYPIERFTKMDMSYGNIFGILDVLKKHPNPDWRMSTLSKHPSLNMNIIKNNLDIHWNFYYLSSHPNITMKDIEDNIDLKWCWKRVIYNPNFSVNMFKKYPDKLWDLPNYQFNKGAQSCLNPKVIDYILENIHNHDLKDRRISCAATIELIKKYPNIEWDWSLVILSYNITMKDIGDNMDLPWDWSLITSSPNFNLDFIKDHPEVECDWSIVSTREFITMDYIEKNPTIPWVDKYILRNPNLTIKMMEKIMYKNKKYSRISDCTDFGLYGLTALFMTDIKIYSRNKIYYCWKRKNIRNKIEQRKKRNIRYKTEQMERMKRLNIELKFAPPFANFKGGIEYIAAMDHFNELK